MAITDCAFTEPPPRRATDVCFLVIISASAAACGLFAGAIPDVLRYRVSQEHWTGRWVEIAATSFLGSCALTYSILFLISFHTKRWMYVINGANSTFLNLCILSLIYIVSAGGSQWWKSIPGAGSSDEQQSGTQVYLVCNTITKKGPDCQIKTLRRIHAFQVTGIVYTSMTLLAIVVFMILTVKANATALKQKWHRRMDCLRRARSGEPSSVSASMGDDVLPFSNEVSNQDDVHNPAGVYSEVYIGKAPELQKHV